MFGANELRRALDLLGQILEDRGHSSEIVVIGGGALLLQGWITRPTKDLDALAVVEDGVYRSAKPFPDLLQEAIEDVAPVLGMDNHWLNPGPTAQLGYDLPEGFRERTARVEFHGIVVHLAGRFDQICLKLYAAADHDHKSKHVADLIALAPDADEFARAATWVKRQDAGPEFASFVDAVIQHVEAARGSR
ncbi:MAG TPA: DUF6036 family nucleotidyltransferase [Kofleriaceae bacterium]|nr:DUF6036 family nucleotidyltransferase [Kofleriaceae bacterium]